VEEYILLSAMLHVLAGLKRTWDFNLKKGALCNGTLNLGVSGVVLLCFMTIHLFQFRFGATEDYWLRPPPYLVYFAGILQLQLFWTPNTGVNPVAVRDIYKMEFDRFLRGFDLNGTQIPIWSVIYIASTFVFVFHACFGWKKVISAPAMGIPKGHQERVKWIGYVIFWVLGITYISFPVYVLSMGAHACGDYGKSLNGTGSLNSINCVTPASE
jgi:succinate dehydrogenase/fumarate reductase cytochrome b subunit